MIVGVPDHRDLNATAIGWMVLAWQTIIKEADDFQRMDFLFDKAEAKYGGKRVQAEIENYWNGQRLLINNAISILQQSLEIFLKARIAAVSPFLLIAGEPSSWPSVDKLGHTEFSNFRTIDAVHLCRATKIISVEPLSEQFVQFYDKLRKSRNKIIHLDASSIKAEVSAVLVDVLTAHKYLFPQRKLDFI